jgi:hypothetical protein
VIVRNLNNDLVPDLAVVNGGSGTITELRGVGGGFFDDRQPKVLFNLGSSVVQPPTFTGDSGVGFAVTATGDLVRFDLNNPNSPASVVFSGRQVLAAQALPSGQVVVALANGFVDFLVPRGNGLSVSSELLPTSGIPGLPSAIDVLPKPNGLLDILVSSQGSDTLSVFSLAASPAEPVVPSGGLSPPSFSSSQSPTVTATQAVLLTANVSTTASVTAASASTSATTNSGALSATSTSAVGLSLGTFSSLGNGSTKGTGEAVLAQVEGNSYLSVPVLGVGSENEEEGDKGEGRMPWLSTAHPFGDTSPLSRFVIGLDEALRAYRGLEEIPLLKNSGPAHDPWTEDLFFRHLPIQPPGLGQEKDDPMEGDGPEAMLPNVQEHRLQDGREAHARYEDDRFDEPGFLPSFPAAQVVARLQALAGLLAALLLTPAMTGDDSWDLEKRVDLVPAKAKRDGE